MPDTALIFGLGYTARRFAHALLKRGWQVVATRRTAAREAGIDVMTLEDRRLPAVIAGASAILSSVPPDTDAALPDPVLRAWHDALAASPARWIGYLSSTGVYGDTRGGWVDEASPIGGGRRSARVDADLAWQGLAASARAPVHVFRLPGIYGPGRSALDRVREGRAHRIDLPDHVFSRIHVDDIVATLLASLDRPGAPGTAHLYNVADDEPASGNAVTEHACDLLGLPWPPLRALDEAGLSPMARGFYAECRRVANQRIKRDLGVRLLYPSYREGLDACFGAVRDTGDET